MSRATEVLKPFDAIGRQMGAAKKTKVARRAAHSPAPDYRVRRPHAHVVQFYSHDSHLLDSLAGLVEQSLNEGNSAIVIATDAHRTGLCRRLEASGISTDRLMREYRLIVLDAEASLASILANGVPDARRFEETIKPVLRRAAGAAVSHRPQVVAFGEMVALLWLRGEFEAAIRLEQIWNVFQIDENFFLYCAYPSAGFDRGSGPEDFHRIRGQHSQVIPDECVIMDVRDRVRVNNIASQSSQPRMAVSRAPVAPERPMDYGLPARLLRAQDEQHRRMARDLHDSTGQKLALLSMNLSLMEAQASNSQLAQHLAESRKVLREVSSELRALSYALHPPLLEELGLVAALKWFVEGFKERSGITVSVNVGEGMGRLSGDIELALFRVIQEALTNAQQHSGTTTAEVSLECQGDAVILKISDAGKGIGVEQLAEIESAGAPGAGLGGMKERVLNLGGRLEVLSGDRGTEIRAALPAAAPVAETNPTGCEAS